MREETRITENPQPKDTRITANLSPETDARIRLLPEGEEPKSSLLQRLLAEFPLHWVVPYLVFFFAFGFWLEAYRKEQRIRIQRMEAEGERLKKDRNRLIREAQPGK